MNKGKAGTFAELVRTGLVKEGDVLRYIGDLLGVGVARAKGVQVEGRRLPGGVTAFEVACGSRAHRPNEFTFDPEGLPLQELIAVMQTGRPADRARTTPAPPFSFGPPANPPGVVVEPAKAALCSGPCGPLGLCDYVVPLREDNSDEVCRLCSYGGDLVLCDTCPAAYHTRCLGLAQLPEGDWCCPACRCAACGGADWAEQVVPAVRGQVMAESAAKLNIPAHVDSKNGAHDAVIDESLLPLVHVPSYEEAVHRAAERQQLLADADMAVRSAQCAPADDGRHYATPGSECWLEEVPPAGPPGDRRRVRCPGSWRCWHLGCLQEQHQQLVLSGDRCWFSQAVCADQALSLVQLCCQGQVSLAKWDHLPVQCVVINGAAVRNPTDCSGFIPKYSDKQRQYLRRLLSAACAVMKSACPHMTDRLTGMRVVDMLTQGWSSPGLAADFSGFHTAVLTIGSTVVGAALLRLLGPQLMELPVLAIRPEVQGNGLGRVLLHHLERCAHGLNVRHVVSPAYLPQGQLCPETMLSRSWHVSHAGYAAATAQQRRLAAQHRALFFPLVPMLAKELVDSSCFTSKQDVLSQPLLHLRAPLDVVRMPVLSTGGKAVLASDREERASLQQHTAAMDRHHPMAPLSQQPSTVYSTASALGGIHGPSTASWEAALAAALPAAVACQSMQGPNVDWAVHGRMAGGQDMQMQYSSLQQQGRTGSHPGSQPSSRPGSRPGSRSEGTGPMRLGPAGPCRAPSVHPAHSGGPSLHAGSSRGPSPHGGPPDQAGHGVANQVAWLSAQARNGQPLNGMHVASAPAPTGPIGQFREEERWWQLPEHQDGHIHAGADGFAGGSSEQHDGGPRHQYGVVLQSMTGVTAQQLLAASIAHQRRQQAAAEQPHMARLLHRVGAATQQDGSGGVPLQRHDAAKHNGQPWRALQENGAGVLHQQDAGGAAGNEGSPSKRRRLKHALQDLPPQQAYRAGLAQEQRALQPGPRPDVVLGIPIGVAQGGPGSPTARLARLVAMQGPGQAVQRGPEGAGGAVMVPGGKPGAVRLQLVPGVFGGVHGAQVALAADQPVQDPLGFWQRSFQMPPQQQEEQLHALSELQRRAAAPCEPQPCHGAAGSQPREQEARLASQGQPESAPTGQQGAASSSRPPGYLSGYAQFYGSQTQGPPQR